MEPNSRSSCLAIIALFLTSVCATDVYMDSPTACGRTFPAGENDVFNIKPRGSVGVSNPPMSCIVTLESAYSSSNYKFEVVVEASQFNDCSFDLRIFDGMSVGGGYIKMLGCGTSSSPGHSYSKDRAITLQLERLRDQYTFGNHFHLRVQLYYDTTAPDEYTGTYQFPVGGIVGVVLGLIVFITAAILLGWCYKTGRLPGVGGYDYPATKASTDLDNLSRSQLEGMGGEAKNGGFVAWHNTEGQSVTSDTRSNFNLDDSTIWQSLTSINTPKKDIVNKTQNGSSGGPNAGRGRLQDKNFQRLDPQQLSNSPTTRIRGRGRDYRNDNDNRQDDTYHTLNDNNFQREQSARLMRGVSSEGGKKTNAPGVFVNPDKEGYMYDYDQVKSLEGAGEKDTKKTQDFASELQAAIRRASIKRQKSESQMDSDATERKDGGESSAFNSTSAINKQTDGETTGPEAQSSPKPSKKKRKNSKERKSPKSSRKHKDGSDKSPQKSPKSKSRKSRNLDEQENLPPEAFAPIFSGDDDDDSYSTVNDYSHQYQPGYQGYPPAPPFDPRYPMAPYQPGMPGMPPQGMYPPGMPYQQAGQAQWYMEANPNGQHKMAFAVQTHSQSDDSLNGPAYTSTPYNNNFRNQGNDSALVPAGTILDDPGVPQPGTSLARYDENPITGVKTSQVIWTDAKKDPTDPPPDSSTQVTRKTITRITARSTDDKLSEAPNPSLQDMSWKAAQQIQATGQEPAFMAPTRGAMYPNNAIQYASETPERSNASYYMGGGRGNQRRPSPSNDLPAVIHEEPSRSAAFKDKITLKNEEFI